MKNREVIDRILVYHPHIPNYEGCDGWKAGNPEAECTGVAVALVPTADVIRRTAAMGCNLLVTHEPIYYQTPDFAEWRGGFPNTVQAEKETLIQKLGVSIWRDHDHMHAHQPDSIFSSVVKSLGWEDYSRPEWAGDVPFFMPFELPKTTVGELGASLMDKIGMNGVKYIGRAGDEIQRIAFAAHLFPNAFFPDGVGGDGCYRDYAMSVMEQMERHGIQVIIPGEIIEWTVLAYIRDAVELGKVKACFNLGHFNWEELGMKDFARIIGELVEHKVPVSYLPTGDQWRFLT